VEAIVPQKSSEDLEKDVVALPPTYTVTAPLINDLTFSAKNQRRREKKLTADTPLATATRAAHMEMSKTSINTAAMFEEIESAQEIRRKAWNVCREFEGATWCQRDLRNQDIRTKRAYAMLAAEQRSRTKEFAIQESRSTSVEEVKNEVKDNTSSATLGVSHDSILPSFHGSLEGCIDTSVKNQDVVMVDAATGSSKGKGKSIKRDQTPILIERGHTFE
jgi:hypothetical protein